MSIEKFSETTLCQLLRERAAQHPDKLAFNYLADGESIADSWTYAELLAHASAVAAWLRDNQAYNERVLILHENPLHFMGALFGCMFAGAVAVPAYSPVGRKQVARIGKIVNDSQSRFALQSAESLAATRAAIESYDLDNALTWGASDQLPAAAPATADYEPDRLALIQYTSGSTSDPKGVMLSHANFLHNLESIRGALGAPGPDEQLYGVFWLPLHHDMGLVGAVLTTIYVGGSADLMSPASFVFSPIRWLRLISGKHNVITAAPNFAHELCVESTSVQERAELDLSGWRTALCGAEFVRLDTMNRFAEMFAPNGFDVSALQPVYGLAEATLLVTGSPRAGGPLPQWLRRAALDQRRIEVSEPGADGTAVMVGCGRAQDGTDLVIVDPDTREPVGDDRIGEVWVASGAVALGYWGNATATTKAFEATLARPGKLPAGPYLRTGDLGFLHQGELFVAARLKDLIIVRGRNLYPDDVEATVQDAHPMLLRGRGAAVTVDSDAGEQIVIVQEVLRDTPDDSDFASVFAAIATAVTGEFDVAVADIVLVRTYSLPSTSSGKVQRFASREKYLSQTLKVVATWGRAKAPDSNDIVAEDISPPPSSTAIQRWLIEHLAAELKTARAEIDPRQPFAYYGLDSVHAVKLAGALSAHLGVEVSPTIAYEYPSIAELAEYLAPNAEDAATLDVTPEVSPDDPIAIVGIGCRFPGAAGPQAFWQLVHDGRDAVGPAPADRDLGGAMPVGGFLDDVTGFDAGFFGTAPREAAQIDPQHRIVLETTWEAFEDAGIPMAGLAGEPVGVFVGIANNDYARLLTEDQIDAYTGIGNAHAGAANRISYHFDFRGPSVAIDTACSSALVAIHNACASLRTGDAAIAIAGGVNLVLSQSVSLNLEAAGVLSADGQCKPFDATGDGYVRSEGAGVVVLEPLSRAQAAGRRIYAVIRGSAVNQDGRTNGIMAPSRRAQEALLRTAFQRAGATGADLGYVEAQGTGTALGDAIEAAALAAVLGENREHPCAVGSVKSNLGHTEAAAGIAGVIKVALALRNRKLPPTINTRRPNLPDQLRLATAAEDWTDRLLAGVSALGFGGTNAHVVLAAAPTATAPTEEARTDRVVLGLSAADDRARTALAARYLELLSEPSANWHNVAYSVAHHRDQLTCRLAVVAGSRAEAVELLDVHLRGAAHEQLVTGHAPVHGAARLAFVFSDEDPSWADAARALFERESEFRAALATFDREIRRRAGWSMLDELHADARLSEPTVSQPIRFAVQVAVAQLWMSRGVIPDGWVGTESAAIAAAYVAGELGFGAAVDAVLDAKRLPDNISLDNPGDFGFDIYLDMGCVAPNGGVRALATGTDLLTVQAELYCAGYPVDWARLHPDGSRTELPTYPWQRTRHWLPGSGKGAAPRHDPQLVSRIRGAEGAERTRIVRTYLTEVVGHRLNLPPNAVDSHNPLRYSGLDSIGAMAIKLRVERDLPVSVPLAQLLEGPSVAELADWLVAELDIATPDVVAAAELLGDIDSLSEADVDRLLAELAAEKGNSL